MNFLKHLKNKKNKDDIIMDMHQIFLCIISFLCLLSGWFTGLNKNKNTEMNTDNITNNQEESILNTQKDLLYFNHPLEIVNMSIILNYNSIFNINNKIEESDSNETDNPNTDEEIENIEKVPSYDNYEFINGWIIEGVNIKSEPNIEAEILSYYGHNHQIEYSQYDEEWSVIKYKDNYAFVLTVHISKEKCSYNVVNVPWFDLYKGNKTWMPYTAISHTRSPQYKLQQIAYTGTYGIRMYDGRYCIAVGTAVTSDVGVYIDVVLENGTVIPCIVGDIKADIHTNAENIFTTHSNCCSEFIVDMNYLDPYVKLTGNVSKACTEWDSKVVKFKIYNDIDIVDW